MVEAEVQGKNIELEVENEKGRKRKIVEEEEEKQRSEEELDEFIYDKGYEIMEKKILKKDFIGERRFKEFISSFKETIEKRGWSVICKHMPLARAALVKEFYANLVDMKETQCYVKEKWVSLNRHDINKLLKLRKLSDGTKFKKLKKNLDYQKIVEVFMAGKGEWRGNKKKPYESMARGSLTGESTVWFYFLCSILMPTKHVNTLRQKEAIMLYAILKWYKISLGKLIEHQF